jgi:Dolichyl-phosphate-mannose-protein mannosyltransferase
VKRIFDHAAAMPLAILALTLVGGVVRLVVAGQDLFADELATYWVVSTRGLVGVVETVSTTAEITPPLGFVLSWLTSRMGLSPELVRLPALIAGIASIPLVYAVGARTVGRGAALLAAAMTTLSPFMIYYSAEARGYGVLMAFVLASTLALLVAIEDGRARWWVVYGAFVCLATYTHYTSVFVLAAQLGWAFWVHPRSRRPLVLSTGAAVLLYLPWLPSLRGDLDSPTTEILSNLSPVDLESIRLTLGHWMIGFPYAGPRTALHVLPGFLGLVLLAASLCVGAYGLFTMRSRLGEWFAAHEGRFLLVALLALATPVGTGLQSAVGTNVFSTRSLAGSWPYLALAVAALITVGQPAVRVVAAGLAVAAFAVGIVQLRNSEFQRPDFSRLASYAEDHPADVVVDGFAFTPGPLSNMDVEGVDVIRLNVPAQRTTPFVLTEARPDPAEVAARAVAAADGGPILVLASDPPIAVVDEFVANLPPEYELTHREPAPGLLDMQALVYERRDG